MTKQDLQKELLEKVKPGTKPSDLKRSKSADNIPSAPPLPTSLTRSKSQEPFKDPKYPYTTLISQQQRIDELEKESSSKSTTISLLRKKIGELETQSPNSSNSELDQTLFKRHSNLKAWFTQYSKNKKLDKELQENVDEASTELINQDETISTLRTELRTLKQTNQSLHKDLQLAQRAVAWRQTPFSPSPSDNLTYLKPILYSLALVLFTYYLLNARIEKQYGLN